MRRPDRLRAVVVLGCLGAFFLGLAHLFSLRFRAGDIFPPYSTLRADPLGVKALYRSLESIEGLSVARNYRAFDGHGDFRDTTVFFLGVHADAIDDFPRGEAEALERVPAGGGRLVVTLFPRGQGGASPRAQGEGDGGGVRPPPRGTGEGSGSDGGGPSPRVSLAARWGFALDHRVASGPAVLASGNAGGGENSVPWHSATGFREPSPAWRVVYDRGGRAVLMERSWGTGSIVLSSDSYFLSNEALVLDRRPALLAWLTGGSRAAVFDESHLGVRRSPGMAGLARAYRLHGLLAALLLLAALHVWRATAAFLPRRDDHEGRDPGESAGADSLAAYASLLRRSIPPGSFPEACLEEWRRSQGTLRGSQAERFARAVSRAAGGRAHPRDGAAALAAYRDIARILRGEGED